MRALLDGAMLQLRNNITLEIFPGEPISFPDADQMRFVASPVEEDFGVLDEKWTARLTTVGRYTARLTHERTSEVIDAHLVVCEPSLLAFVERQLRSVGHGGDLPSPERARRVARAMCQRPDFDGTIDWVTAHPNNAPVHFGA